MIEILSRSSEACIGFKISGKVTAEDYEIMMPKIDEAIATFGHINLLMLIEDIEGAGMDVAKPDFHFGTHQYRQVDKAAFVTDGKWMARTIKIMDPITRRTKEKTFDLDHLEEAWEWILDDKGEQ
jgi:hypothetical protein